MQAGLLRALILAGSALALGAAASAQPVALDGGAAALPRPAVILFWASWCVPCQAELKRMPTLVPAASPLPLVTLALDPPAKARAALHAFGIAPAMAFADARPPATVLAEWGGAEAALPLAVAIDAHGAICGRKRGLIGTDQLREWAARCSR